MTGSAPALARTSRTGGTEAALLLLFWLQPIIVLHTGVPAGTVLATLVLVHRTVVNTSPAGMRLSSTSLFAAAFAIWALFLSSTGRPLELIWDPLSFAVIVILAPVMLRDPLGTKESIFGVAKVIIVTSTVVVWLQMQFSPTLLGITPVENAGSRISGLHYNSNGGALFVALAMALLVPRLFSRSPSPNATVGRILVFAAGIWTVLAMGSRGALLAVAVAVFLGLALTLSRKSTHRAALMAVGAPLLIVLAIGFSRILARVTDVVVTTAGTATGRVFAADVTNDRADLWRLASRQISESPVLGSDSLNLTRYGVDNVHNAYLETAVTYGLVGGILFVSVITSLFIRGFRYSGANSSRGEAGILVLAAACTFGATHLGLLNNSFLWFATLWLLASPTQPEQEGRFT